MSFSKEVKDELSRQISHARHCQIAEIAAIISLCGKISYEDGTIIRIQSENITVARKYYTLIKKAFYYSCEISVKKNVFLKKSKTYTLYIIDELVASNVLKATKLINSDGNKHSVINSLIVQNSCCKRAFLRGAFLSAGSISDPEKTYHFEIVVIDELKAKKIQEIINSFDIDAKIVIRKKYFVVYIKEGAQIVDMLNVMEAHISLMNLENVRIIKEMRNTVNRQVNCETANLNKTVSAAVKQLEDIKYLQSTIGLSELAKGLEEVALLRLEKPEATLKELGVLLSPQVGKSGVNHRLRKISDIADSLRENKEELIYDNQNNNN